VAARKTRPKAGAKRSTAKKPRKTARGFLGRLVKKVTRVVKKPVRLVKKVAKKKATARRKK
jgi:hypothetical protein